MSIYSEEVGFAAGTLVGTRADITGATPVRFGILQDVSLDFTADLKQLFGQNRYAMMQAPGKTKVEMKAKFAGIRGSLFNDLFFGATTLATRTSFAENESGTVPASSAYTITVTNSATFLADQGVFAAASGLPLKKVPSPPTTAGQYSVNPNTGVYTFASSQAGNAMYISYTYSTTGSVLIPISQVKMGVGPSFQVVLNQAFDGRSQTFTFNNCMASKFSLPTKQDDFQINELDIMVAADAFGNIGSISMDM